MSGFWVFCGTKDYATGLVLVDSLGVVAASSSGFASSADVSSAALYVSSFYALKTQILAAQVFF